MFCWFVLKNVCLQQPEGVRSRASYGAAQDLHANLPEHLRAVLRSHFLHSRSRSHSRYLQPPATPYPEPEPNPFQVAAEPSYGEKEDSGKASSLPRATLDMVPAGGITDDSWGRVWDGD